MKKKTAHIISHTHWDREWYLPYEKHHVRLIKLMDELLELLEQDSAYRSFHLDGQTIIMEDYLQVRPENGERLRKLIEAGRIHIGPWYILQDEFLTSSEANVRNLQIGHADSAAYGVISKLGYFPDSFGNIGQAAQLLKQADIETAVFGRGVTPTGFNNTVNHDLNYESPYSEMRWQSPDGSEVLGILFANWYSNGNEVPVDAEAAKAYWQARIEAAERFASTPHLLYMNGCDHQPVQKDLSRALKTAKEVFPDVEFVHSSFDEYIEALRESLPAELQTVKGELRSQRTDGWGTLVNTASSRVYIKQANERGQTLLEKVAEPLAAWAHLLGEAYPQHLFTYAWKTLMQNHPHDSICACSVDEVPREMLARFEKSRHVAESIVESSTAVLAEAVDTSCFAGYGTSALPFVVWNTTGWSRSGTVRVQLDVDRIYFREGVDFGEMRRRIRDLPLGERRLVDAQGRAVSCTVKDLGLRFGYDLPEDAFRQPYFARTVELEFEALGVPALGHRAYAWVLADGAGAMPEPEATSLVTVDRVMENESIRVRIRDNGSWDLTEKTGGRKYEGLGILEDTGDIGNEYMYKASSDGVAYTTEKLTADIRLLEDTSYRASYEIKHTMMIPASADEELEREQQELVWFTSRKAGRSQEMVELKVRTVLTLERHGQGVLVQTTIDNQAKDHRLRVLLPTDVEAAVHHADSIFEVAERDNVPASEWKNPSYCHHQQAFVSVCDEQGGLLAANKGLNEYEVLRDGRNTIALTLLRATGEMGDWGVFLTPEAQCLGENTVEYMVRPFSGDPAKSRAYASAYQFQVPWTTQATGVHEGRLPAEYAWMDWSGETLALSSVKIAAGTGDLAIRWFNMSAEPTALQVQPRFRCTAAHESDILERRRSPLAKSANNSVSRQVTGHEIVTIALEGSS